MIQRSPGTTRRRFLTGAGALAASAALPAPLRAAARAGIPHWDLSPGPISRQLAGPEYGESTLWAYNASIPGPIIRVDQGQPFRVRLTNGLSQATTLHCHGLRLRNAMDGVPGLTQSPTAPGETFDYEITAPDAGTFWYHPHYQSSEQVARGLYGLLIVDERDPLPVDREILLVVDDWRVTPQGLLDTDSFGSLGDRSHGGRFGNMLTVNGEIRPRFQLRRGERARVRMCNTANARPMTFAFPGHDVTLLALDGQPVAPEELLGAEIALAPGQRADLLLDCNGPDGSSAQIHEVSTGQAMLAAHLDYADTPLRERAPTSKLALPANPLPEPNPLDGHVIDLVMEGGAMGGMRQARYQGQMQSMRALADAGQFWAFNGEIGTLGTSLGTVALGRTVHLTIHNDTAFAHAMHLHGHHFRVIARNGQSVRAEPWRDTELVPRGERLTLAFVADNPGKWALHCHMLEHAASGMMAHFEVV
ncbi:multicopper oxidase family protein [Rhodovibrio sodomensis]|nr:multicopper oxidase family protein [Rhodovibrio sodomensis]